MVRDITGPIMNIVWDKLMKCKYCGTEVLNRQKNENVENFCEYCNSKTNLEAHHIIPIKMNQNFSLDPDNGLVCCKKCHMSKIHINECSTHSLSKMCKGAQ